VQGVHGPFMARLLNAAWAIFGPPGMCKQEGLFMHVLESLAVLGHFSCL